LEEAEPMAKANAKTMELNDKKRENGSNPNCDITIATMMA
jgi:hypothetical protein